MDTQKNAPGASHFIILIPHTETRKLLEEYRQKLFSAACPGAHSFPLSAPLAELSRPFSRNELKKLGCNIREKTPGKIISSKNPVVQSTERFIFFGPTLNINAGEGLFPEPAEGKILRALLPPVLCAALVEEANRPFEVLPALAGEAPGECPLFSFRAAALANLTIRPLAVQSGAKNKKNLSFQWRIGEPVWLPAIKK